MIVFHYPFGVNAQAAMGVVSFPQFSGASVTPPPPTPTAADFTGMIRLDSAAMVGSLRMVYNDSKDAFRPAPVEWHPLQSPEATTVAAKALNVMATAVKSAKPLGPVLKKPVPVVLEAKPIATAAAVVSDDPMTDVPVVAPRRDKRVQSLGKKVVATSPAPLAPRKPGKPLGLLPKKGAKPMLTMKSPAVTGDLKRVYETQHTAHPTPRGKTAFKKALHSLHKAGHAVKDAVRVAHLAGARADAKVNVTHDGIPKPIQRKTKSTSFKKKGA